jgi:tyrosine aminotransferase
VLETLREHSEIQNNTTSVVQAALPKILEHVTPEFFTGIKIRLKESSDLAFSSLSGIRGLKPIRASAAIYMIVKINIEEFKDIKNDFEFSKMLLEEQTCLVFPGQVFFAKNIFRMVRKFNFDSFRSSALRERQW